MRRSTFLVLAAACGVMSTATVAVLLPWSPVVAFAAGLTIAVGGGRLIRHVLDKKEGKSR